MKRCVLDSEVTSDENPSIAIEIVQQGCEKGQNTEEDCIGGNLGVQTPGLGAARVVLAQWGNALPSGW